MRKLLIIILFSFAIASHGQEQPPIQFSLGMGLDAGFLFGNQKYSSTNENYKFNNSEIGFDIFFDVEILYYALFETIIYTILDTERFDNNDPSKTLWLNLSFSLFGQYPFYLNRNLRLSPLLGFSFTLRLFHKDDYSFSWRGNEEIVQNNDQVWLKLGGIIEYHLTDHILFHSRMLYNIQIYRRWVAKNTDVNQSKHGPSIILGIKYVF